MKHMLGDYYSTIPTGPGLWIAVILTGIVLLMIAVGLRRAKVREDKERRRQAMMPVRARATFVASQHIASQEEMRKYEPRSNR